MNYPFTQKAEIRNGLEVKAWFITAGSILYGGNDGIEGFIKLHPVWAKGKDEIEIYAGTLTWNFYLAPQRTRVAGNSVLIDYDDAVITDGDGSGILTGLDGTNKKVTDLPGTTNIDENDLIIVGSSTTGALSKITFAAFKALFPTSADITKFIYNETPIGLINGTNKVFNLLNLPVTGKQFIELNGIGQVPLIDYTISGTAITFTKAPVVIDGIADQIRTHYIKQ